jgi:predicted 2-oxoglutarate/Fe(II)-dependent dioxygenase YbiX
MGACFKQADALVYHGAQNGDWVGWHDHGGESVLFAVVLLADPAGFEGGTFCYRRADTGAECTLELGLGDAVVCMSHTEHCVRPVSGGVRFSLNVDFWAVASDNRSDADRY